MMRISLATVVASTVLLAGCGDTRTSSQGQTKGMETGAGPAAGAGAAPAAAPAGPMKVPDWMKVDRAKKAVTMQIEAGKTEANNHWNFNGFANGDATIAVPVNYWCT